MRLIEFYQAPAGRLLAIVHGRAISFRKLGRAICFAHIGRSLCISSTDVENVLVLISGPSMSYPELDSYTVSNINRILLTVYDLTQA
jgi:hypothetical protein